MAIKTIKKQLSETKKRVDLEIEVKPGFFQDFEPWKAKLYIVSPTPFDELEVESMLQEVVKNRENWKDCKKKACTKSYPLKSVPRANAYIDMITPKAEPEIESESESTKTNDL